MNRSIDSGLWVKSHYFSLTWDNWSWVSNTGSLWHSASRATMKERDNLNAASLEMATSPFWSRRDCLDGVQQRLKGWLLHNWFILKQHLWGLLLKFQLRPLLQAPTRRLTWLATSRLPSPVHCAWDAYRWVTSTWLPHTTNASNT